MASVKPGNPDVVALSAIELAFWTKTVEDPEEPLSNRRLQLVESLENPVTFLPPAAQPIDLSTYSYKAIVYHLLQVQEAKLKYRGQFKQDGSFYNTKYMSKVPNDLNDLDPLAEEIAFMGEIYALACAYDGAAKAKQPGNCVFKPKKGKMMTYDEVPDGHFKNPEAMLLLLIEIVRRRAIDPHHERESGGLKDEYHDLPVGLGIAMAYKLVEKKKIEFDTFWKKDQLYHMFTGGKDARYNAFCEIYKTYAADNEEVKSENLHEHMRALMEEIYQKTHSASISDDNLRNLMGQLQISGSATSAGKSTKFYVTERWMMF